MSGGDPADNAAREAMRRLTEGLRGVTDQVQEGIAAVRREIANLDRSALDAHVVADHPDLGSLDADLRATVELFPDDPPA